MSRLVVLFCFVSFFTLDSFSAINTYGDITFEKAINISGKQRYLSQKIIKEALFSFNNGTDLGSNIQLMSTKLIFERHHKLLLENATSDEIKDALSEVESAYIALERHIANEDKRNAAEVIFLQSNAMLRRCQEVVDAIVSSSVSHAANAGTGSEKQAEYSKIISISGKQRMLSQKMIMLYIASTGGFLKRAVEMKEVISTMEEFDDGLTTLLISSQNDESVLNGLSMVMMKWNRLQGNKAALEAGELSIAEFNKDCDFFLDCFNKITGMYEELLASK